MPSWAGQPHETSLASAKPKAKSKAKSRAKAAAKAQSLPSSDTAARTARGSGSSKDPELEKIELQRAALVTTRKWQTAAASVSDDVSKVLEYSMGIDDASEFLSKRLILCLF